MRKYFSILMLLASNAECSNNLPPREFAYLTKEGLTL